MITNFFVFFSNESFNDKHNAIFGAHICTLNQSGDYKSLREQPIFYSSTLTVLNVDGANRGGGSNRGRVWGSCCDTAEQWAKNIASNVLRTCGGPSRMKIIFTNPKIRKFDPTEI